MGVSPRDASHPTKVAVLGAGGWGSVLADLLAQNGVAVSLWTRRAETVQALRRERLEARHNLTANDAAPAVSITTDLAEACDAAEAVVAAVPSVALPDLYARLEATGVNPVSWVSTAKGLMDVQLTTPHAWLTKRVDVPVAVLSGPNLAHEIAAGKPAATVVSSHDAAFVERVRGWFHQATFRVYINSDPQGVEVGGAYKNVIAIAAGMSDALGLGTNATAALVSRGLAEMVRLGDRLGGKAATLYGLAGVGDLVATCLTVESRNHQAGRRLAAGESGDAILASGLTAEGLRSVQAIAAHGRGTRLNLPIAEHVFEVAFGTLEPNDAVERLMTRQAAQEA